MGGVKKREVIAWAVIAVQALALFALIDGSAQPDRTAAWSSGSRMATTSAGQNSNTGNVVEDVNGLVSSLSRSLFRSPMSINNHHPDYHDKIAKEAAFSVNATAPFYDAPTIYPPSLVSREWHSNASPNVHPDLQKGTCWCSTDDYCMCTPSLAVDVVVKSGPDHVWLVERRDSGRYALVGGFNEVGETVEEAARRELLEETGLDFPETDFRLFGVYSDPKRDARKHSVSVVFTLDLPADTVLRAGDDAVALHRVALQDIDRHTLHVDHHSVLLDYVAQQKHRQLRAVNFGTGNTNRASSSSSGTISMGEPFRRSTCN